jgi:hypothetical protein
VVGIFLAPTTVLSRNFTGLCRNHPVQETIQKGLKAAVGWLRLSLE